MNARKKKKKKIQWKPTTGSGVYSSCFALALKSTDECKGKIRKEEEENPMEIYHWEQSVFILLCTAVEYIQWSSFRIAIA